MLKFFRKYNTIILVFGGVLLMIVFVAPQAVQQLAPDPMDQKVGTIVGASLTARDLDLATREAKAIREWSPGLAVQMLGLEEEPMHWLLLSTEAERGGFIGEAADGPEFIPELARQALIRLYTGQVSNPELIIETEFGQNQYREIVNNLTSGRRAVAGQNRLTLEEFDRAIAKARGVLRMTGSYFRQNRMSRQRLVEATKYFDEEVYANALFIRGLMYRDQAPQPTDADLEALFEEKKDIVRTEAEDRIGYTLAPRIKLEILRVDALDMIESIPLDPVEVRKRYQQNRNRFPAGFESERTLVERELRDERARELLQSADQRLRMFVSDKLRRVPEDDAGYKQLPEDWEASFGGFEPAAERIQQALTASLGQEAPLPSVIRYDSSFLTLDEVAELPELAGAIATVGDRRFRPEDVAFGVYELFGDNPYGLQVGVPAMDMVFKVGTSTNIYIRVTDFRDQSPPDDWTEVRDMLATDYELIQSTEYLASLIPAYLESAKADGLSTFATTVNPPIELDENGEEIDTGAIVAPYQYAARFTNTFVETVIEALEAENVRDRVMELGTQIDPLLREASIPADQRYFAVETFLPKGYAIFEMVGYLPPRAQSLRRQDAVIRRLGRTQELRDNAEGLPVFSMLALAERLQLESDVIDLEEYEAEYRERSGLTEEATGEAEEVASTEG